MSGIIDKYLGKWASRKLMVFTIATILTLLGDVTSSDWVTISAVYIGGQTVIDSISILRKQ